jgi:hypothetical protein
VTRGRIVLSEIRAIEWCKLYTQISINPHDCGLSVDHGALTTRTSSTTHGSTSTRRARLQWKTWNSTSIRRLRPLRVRTYTSSTWSATPTTGAIRIGRWRAGQIRTRHAPSNLGGITISYSSIAVRTLEIRSTSIWSRLTAWFRTSLAPVGRA